MLDTKSNWVEATMWKYTNCSIIYIWISMYINVNMGCRETTTKTSLVQVHLHGHMALYKM